MLKKNNLGKSVNYASFQGENEITEYYIAVHSDFNISFSEMVAAVYSDYIKTLEALDLSDDTQIFSRIFLSDISNQSEILLRSELFDILRIGAYSVIQQCPLNSGDISLFSYHLKSRKGCLEKLCLELDNEHWSNGVRVSGENHDMYWTGNFSGMGQGNSFDQTCGIFTAYNDFLNENGLTLLNNTVRTWLHVRDIDNNYQGTVDSRKDFYYTQSLNPRTRYIASTAIEGKMKEQHSLVSLDALSFSNLKPDQIIRMEALDNLCPPDDYGVTFERGSKIVFGDRSHLYLSGTASIDKFGHVLYPADIIRQTERTLENIEALLRPHGATLRDLTYLIVYLRNIKDAERVRRTLSVLTNEHVPLFLVQASVCRPSWLIEIEGMAIKDNKNPLATFL